MNSAKPQERPVTFQDLPKARQVRALQAYSEGFRRVTAPQGGGMSTRHMRRAHAARQRSQAGTEGTK